MVFNRKEYMKKYYEEHKEKLIANAKEYYQGNKETILENKKEYRNKPIVKMKQKEYHKNYDKIYSKRSEVKNRQKEHQKEYKKKNPQKVKVRGMARYYLKHLKKPGFEFHHSDYSQPLLVEVLPIAEHRALHAQLNHIPQIK